MAHIRKRILPSGNVRWQCVWEAKGKWVSEMFETKGAASAKKIAVESKMPMATETFASLAGAYLAEMRTSAEAGGHSHSYFDHIESYLNVAMRDKEFAKLSCLEVGTPEVQNLLARVNVAMSRSAASKLRAVLLQTFNFGTRQGFSNINPVSPSSIAALSIRDVERNAITQARVYFLQAANSGLIKIGFSNNPHRRLRSMSTGSTEPLKMLGSIPGYRADEKKLHDRFHHLRHRGEWFRPDPVLLGFIQQATNS